MRLVKIMAIVLLISLIPFINGCGCRNAASNEMGYGDLMIGLIVSQPLIYYYGTTGYLEVWGPNGVYLTKEVPMYLGNQVIMFRNMPIGRFVASLSYSGLVTTKCAVLCGTGEPQWRSECAEGLKNLLKGKKNNDSWDYRGQDQGGWNAEKPESDFASPCGAVGHAEGCQTVIIFNMPEDALKYDP